MANAASRILNAQLELKSTGSQLTRLLRDLEDAVRGADDHYELVVLYQDLLDYQQALRSSAAVARKELLATSHRKPGTNILRELTQAEILASLADEDDPADEQKAAAAHAARAEKRLQNMRRLTGHRDVGEIYALIAWHRTQQR